MATSAITGLTDEQEAARRQLASQRGQEFFGGIAQGVGSMLDPADPFTYLGAAGKLGRRLFAAGSALKNTEAEAVLSGKVPAELAAKATSMLQAGASPGYIFQQTGLSKVPTAEGKFTWGKTLSDAEATINPSVLEKLKDNLTKASLFNRQTPVENITLKDLLSHPTLYKEYPEIGNISVEQVNGFQAMGGVQGFYDIAANTLGVQKLNPYTTSPERVAKQLKDLTSTLLHESQHAIQGIEKWPRGGSSSEFTLESTQKASKTVQGAKQSLEDAVKTAFISMGKKPPSTGIDRLMTKVADFKNNGDDALKFVDAPTVEAVKIIANSKDGENLFKSYDRISKVAAKVSDRERQVFEKYRSIAGEAQARAVQKQYETGDYNFPFTSSYDMPIENLIYRDPFAPTIK